MPKPSRRPSRYTNRAKGVARRIPRLATMTPAEDHYSAIPDIRQLALADWPPNALRDLYEDNRVWALRLGTTVAEQIIFQLELFPPDLLTAPVYLLADHVSDGLALYRLP